VLVSQASRPVRKGAKLIPTSVGFPAWKASTGAGKNAIRPSWTRWFLREDKFRAKRVLQASTEIVRWFSPYGGP
jgi:hypothetical protein